MRTRSKFFSVIIALLPVIAVAGNPVRIMEGLSMYSRILGQEVKYSVILPDEYFSSNKSFPVVYLLHGLGDNESSWLEYGRLSQFIDEERRTGQIIPAIYIMPQGFRSYYVNDYLGKFRYEDMFIKEFIPYIDSAYRTIPDGRHRAITGYSMGGFGALVLPLKHPDVFSVSVPLSISVRTDSQYMTESPQDEWDRQWGRLFGGEEKSGKERITEYYKQNSPFYLIKNNRKIHGLKIYIDNGDDEQTLAKSNEELHMLMMDNAIRHEFRVRNGGHEFSYWREALPNALRFISDAFENKPYRGDQKLSPHTLLNETAINKEQLIRMHGCFVALPPEYNETARLYPVLYFVGPFDTVQMKKISALIHEQTTIPDIPPCILIFTDEKQNDLLSVTVTEMEKNFRIRPGKRFRALLAYNNGSRVLLQNMQLPESFTAFVLSDARFTSSENGSEQILAGKQDHSFAWYYFDAPSNGSNYRFFGNLHIQFREKEIYHEYRVREGNGGFEWFFEGLPNYIKYVTTKIHR
jgi:enterochelin esterase-like enzyme